MRWSRLLIVTALVASACAGDDDGAAPITTRATSTTPSTLALTPVGAADGPRVVRVRDLDLAASETFGVALHPGREITLTARTDDNLEVCQATTDAELDPSFGSWPGDGFDACIQFTDGRAVIPAPPVNTYHVGFAVRGPAGTKAATIDELTIDYEAVDGFFLLGFPPVEVGEATPPVVIVPNRSTSVVIDTYGSASLEAHNGIDVTVMQGGHELPRHQPDEEATHGLPYGPAAPGEPAEILGRATEAFERPTFIVNWS